MPSKITVERLGESQAQRKTANIIYFDAAIRHQIGIRNLTTGQVNELVGILEKADQDLRSKLDKLLRPFVGKSFSATSDRYKSLLLQIKAARAVALRHIKKEFKNNLIDLAKIEEEFERRMLAAALPVELDFEAIPTETLIALIQNKPIASGPTGAKTLDQWFTSLERVDLERIISAVQLGILEGESIKAIVARVAGSRSLGFQDGILSLSRTNLEAIVRTAVNSISNTARETVWEANADIMEYLIWTSTLDGRTSVICRSRDGNIVILGGNPVPAKGILLEPQSARPPAHVNCRSMMVATFSRDGIVERIGERPFVRSVDRPDKRRIEFRAQAKAKAGDSWASMNQAERRQATRSIANAWADKHIGRVPSSISYQDWLKVQPSAFQDQVLGKTKGKLFRTGQMTVHDFVTTQGNAVTLKQLANSDPTAFIAAGLSPEDF
jgi:hypothetical protein